MFDNTTRVHFALLRSGFVNDRFFELVMPVPAESVILGSNRDPALDICQKL